MGHWHGAFRRTLFSYLTLPIHFIVHMTHPFHITYDKCVIWICTGGVDEGECLAQTFGGEASDHKVASDHKAATQQGNLHANLDSPSLMLPRQASILQTNCTACWQPPQGQAQGQVNREVLGQALLFLDAPPQWNKEARVCVRARVPTHPPTHTYTHTNTSFSKTSH